MNTITKIQISRCSSIFGNRLAAILHLDGYKHSVGQPVMVRYTDENGETDTITAIGVKSGVGRDCYSIISFGQESIVGDVFSSDYLPDVSTLVHNIPYIAVLDGSWKLFFIDEGSHRQMRDLEDGEKFYSLADSHMYYFNGKNVFRDDKEIDLLNSKFSILAFGDLDIRINYPQTLFKPGETIERPQLDIEVLDSEGNNLTSECTYSAIDQSGKSIGVFLVNGKLVIADTIDSEKEYTITVSYLIPNTSDPISTTSKIKFEYHQPLYYGVVLGEENEHLWNESGSLDLEFSLVNQKSYIKVPSSWPRFKHIFDINGLDYINDYKITRLGDWTVYEKLVAVTIDNFIQRFTR